MMGGMNSEAMINIDLRDIHLPNDVPWWPLATGWWMLGASLLILTLIIYYWYQKNKQVKSLRALAKYEFNLLQQQTLSNHELFKALHLLLRRVSNLLPGSETFNRDTKGLWIDWLTEELNVDACSIELKRQLLTIPYQIDQIPETNELLCFTQNIINGLPEYPIHHSYNKLKVVGH